MQINIHEAKTHFSRLIEKALAGEEVNIARNGTPILTLKPIPAQEVERKPGLSFGKGKIGDDFDEPLNTEILNEFERRSKNDLDVMQL